jgi:hypothetical protein
LTSTLAAIFALLFFDPPSLIGNAPLAFHDAKLGQFQIGEYVRPLSGARAEQLAAALYKDFTLMSKEVGHPRWPGFATWQARHRDQPPEAVDHPSVLLEMTIQGGPMSR